MALPEAVRALVRERLGCGCPEAVFEQIRLDYRGGISPEADLRIGARLLVYLRLPSDEAAAEAALADWLERGRRARDLEGLNRFRLVLGLPPGAALSARLEQRFLALADGDSRVHLHLVPPGELGELLGG